MQRAIPSTRLMLAAIASVLMLIAIAPINLAGGDPAPAAGNRTMPVDGCPPTC